MDDYDANHQTGSCCDREFGVEQLDTSRWVSTCLRHVQTCFRRDFNISINIVREGFSDSVCEEVVYSASARGISQKTAFHWKFWEANYLMQHLISITSSKSFVPLFSLSILFPNIYVLGIWVSSLCVKYFLFPKLCVNFCVKQCCLISFTFNFTFKYSPEPP